MIMSIMFDKYSQEAVRQISPDRHQMVQELFKKYGGERKGEYCMLGEKDVLFIVELSSDRKAMKLSVASGKTRGATLLRRRELH